MRHGNTDILDLRLGVALALGEKGRAPTPARSLDRMRLKREYREPLAAGRLLLISPFGEGVRRITAETAAQ